MYIRWQSRKRAVYRPAFGPWRKKNGRPVIDKHWSAVLVENVRIKGKPTQRHVAYLGGITESAIALETPAQRIYFWDGVEQKLAGLKLPVKTHAAIVQAIGKRVPPVTSKQRQQLAEWLDANGFAPAKARHP
jgi:hypothetical protein